VAGAQQDVVEGLVSAMVAMPLAVLPSELGNLRHGGLGADQGGGLDRVARARISTDSAHKYRIRDAPQVLRAK